MPLEKGSMKRAVVRRAVFVLAVAGLLAGMARFHDGLLQWLDT